MFASSVVAATLSVTCFTLSVVAQSADWPSWRGPDRTDHSPDTGLLKSWPKDGPEQLWVYSDAGTGYAGYSIVDGKLYTLGSRDGIVCLISIDAETGKELWVTEVTGVFTNKWGDGPRATPTVDGDRVYAVFGKGELVCARTADGDILWKSSLRRDLGGKVPGWGYTESALVDGDLVIVTPGGKQGALAALDKMSGEVKWRSSDVTDGAQYSSPIVIENGGKRQYVQLLMKKIVGVDAANGDLLWESEWPGRTAVIPTPIYRDGKVYISSGYGVGSKLIDLKDGGEPEDVWENQNMINHHGGVVLVEDHLYGFSDKHGLVCQSWKDGDMVWQDKTSRKGAVHYADGMLYCLDEGNGSVSLVEASPRGYKEKGRFTLDPQTEDRNPKGKIWTHPVVIGGRLYLRDQEYLHCYKVSK